MDTLMDALYLYAQERKMGPLLNGLGRRFHLARAEADTSRDALCQTLTGDSAALFARYLEQSDAVNDLEQLALLRCGISMGLELGRL